MIIAAVVDCFWNKLLQFETRFATSILSNGYNFFLSRQLDQAALWKKQLIKIKHMPSLSILGYIANNKCIWFTLMLLQLNSTVWDLKKMACIWYYCVQTFSARYLWRGKDANKVKSKFICIFELFTWSFHFVTLFIHI